MAEVAGEEGHSWGSGPAPPQQCGQKPADLPKLQGLLAPPTTPTVKSTHGTWEVPDVLDLIVAF